MLWFVALILGWLLVEGQPSPGGSWSNPYFLSLETAHISWGLLLAGLSACLWGAGKRTIGWGFLLVVGLGAWLPMLLLDAPYFRIGPGMATALMVLMGIVLGYLGRRGHEAAQSTPDLKLFGILLMGGVGTALGLHGLARILSRMSDSGQGSTSVTLATLIILMAVGAFSFGRPLPSDAKKRDKFHAFVWVALILAVFAAMRAEETLGTDRGLLSLMRRFGLDSSYAGTTVGELLTSVSVLILPAFALGTLALILRDARRVSVVIMGAALGTFLVPLGLISQGFDSAGLQPSLQLVLIGMILILSTACSVWLRQNNKVASAIVGLSVIALGFGYRSIMPKDPILVAKPWQRTLVEPIWQLETPQGQLAVTSDGMGSYQVLLDQVSLTAHADQARLHARCMELSMGLLPEETRKNARILLIGVLSPHIANRLHGLGASTIDRLTPFDAAATKACEEVVAGGQNVPESLGDRIGAAEASRRLRDDRYDLVLGLPVQGIHAPWPGDIPESKARVLIWKSLDGLQSSFGTDQPLLLCSDGLARFAVAWTSLDPEQTVGGVWGTMGADADGVSRFRWNKLRPWDRSPVALSHGMRSLAAGASDSDADLFRGLADLFEAQQHSSPFETEFQRFELPRDEVVQLVQAMQSGSQSQFHLELAGGLARTMVGKRDVGAIMEFLPGLSTALGEPFELERSLARAEMESLEPAAAATRLLRLRKAWPQEESMLEELAAALDQSGQAAEAVKVWETLKTIHGGEWHFEKGWVLSLVRAGDARGPEALRNALAKAPKDPDLLSVSQSGPLPPVEQGFQPSDGSHEGHDHD